jgi:hypothetical protein
MKLQLICAGETAYTPADNFIVATLGGKVIGRFENEDDAKVFIALKEAEERPCWRCGATGEIK